MQGFAHENLGKAAIGRQTADNRKRQSRSGQIKPLQTFQIFAGMGIAGITPVRKGRCPIGPWLATANGAFLEASRLQSNLIVSNRTYFFERTAFWRAFCHADASN
jgi:hypothetical protein